MLIYGEPLADPFVIEQEQPYLLINHQHRVQVPGINAASSGGAYALDDDQIRIALRNANVPEPVIHLVQKAMAEVNQLPQFSYEERKHALEAALNKLTSDNDIRVELEYAEDGVFLPTEGGMGVALLVKPRTQGLPTEPPDVGASAQLITDMLKRSLLKAVSAGHSVVIDQNRIHYLSSDEFVECLRKVNTVARTDNQEESKIKSVSAVFNISTSSAATLLRRLDTFLRETGL